jgi:GAF domain-containing protein
MTLNKDGFYIANEQSFCEWLLSQALDVTRTHLGNVQLADWKEGCLKIAAHNGFHERFLKTFAKVRREDLSACGRALKSCEQIVIEDVLSDEGFAPYRDLACAAGFRSVQSTPLVSRNGALVGILSTHFASTYRPTIEQQHALKFLGRLAADIIIRHRAQARPRRAGWGRSTADAIQRSVLALELSAGNLATLEGILARRPRTG